jgi:hypothetical protein
MACSNVLRPFEGLTELVTHMCSFLPIASTFLTTLTEMVKKKKVCHFGRLRKWDLFYPIDRTLAVLFMYCLSSDIHRQVVKISIFQWHYYALSENEMCPVFLVKLIYIFIPDSVFQTI